MITAGVISPEQSTKQVEANVSLHIDNENALPIYQCKNRLKMQK